MTNGASNEIFKREASGPCAIVVTRAVWVYSQGPGALARTNFNVSIDNCQVLLWIP